MPSPHCLPLVVCVLLSHAGPLLAQGGPPDAGREGVGDGARRLLLLESVKAGILSSLGWPGGEEPGPPAARASDRELGRVYALYRETLRVLRANATEAARGGRSAAERRRTVLFPGTGEMHLLL